MIEGTKPLKPYQELGLDVELESHAIANDVRAQTALKDTGRAMTDEGWEYMGSLAVHYYKTPVGRSIATKQQFAIGDMNEAVANMGVSNLIVAFKQLFGRRHTTTDSKDKR